MTSQTLLPLCIESRPPLKTLEEKASAEHWRVGDTVIAYVAGKEIARGRGTPEGHVTHNQQTYLSVTDFYIDSISSTVGGSWWDNDKGHYNKCYRTAQEL